MDTTSKLFIFMIVLALIIGVFVIKFKPHHDLATVYKSNARYYPHINDETVLKKTRKPKPAEEDAAKSSVSPGTDGRFNQTAKPSDVQKSPKGNLRPPRKKAEDNEFVPD